MQTGRTAAVLAALLAVTGCRRQPAVETKRDGVRLVSLAPSLTELIVAIGARDVLAGRTSACDHPADAVASIPIVGGFAAPSFETLLALEPTTVVDTDLEDESMSARFQAAGIHHVRIRCERIDDIPRGIRTLGELAERSEAASELADGLALSIAGLRQAQSSMTNRPGVYVEIWHDPLMTAGRNTYLTDLIALAGGRNIGDTVEQEYFRASPEWVLTQNPDVIICAYMASGRDLSQAVRERPGWGNIRAVQNGAIFCNENNDVLLRPGPRVLEGIEAIRRCIALSQTE
jgi:iron complex transport system substrate-binding protein